MVNSTKKQNRAEKEDKGTRKEGRDSCAIEEEESESARGMGCTSSHPAVARSGCPYGLETTYADSEGELWTDLQRKQRKNDPSLPLFDALLIEFTYALVDNLYL